MRDLLTIPAAALVVLAFCTGAAPTGPRGQDARALELTRIDGLASAGGSEFLSATGVLVPPVRLGSLTLRGAGGVDLVVARLDGRTGAPVWARSYGDDLDQFGQDSTVPTADGTLAVLGRVEPGGRVGTCTGSFETCSGVVVGPNIGVFEADFLLLLDAATGAVRPGSRLVETGTGRLLSVAAHPAANVVAVCGQVGERSSLCQGTTPASCTKDTSFQGGNSDLLVAAFDTTGELLWARQQGGAPGARSDESCNALAVAADGTVWAAGKYTSGLDLGTGPLPALPNSTATRHLWVARFDASGRTLSARAFGTPPGRCAGAPERACSATSDCGGLTPAFCRPEPAGNVTPYDLELDGQGDAVVGGSFTASFSPGGLVSAGGPDAFVLKLGPTLEPLWAVRLGGAGTDLTHALAVAASGAVVAAGTFGASTDGKATSGAAVLRAPPGTVGQAFLLTLDPVTGATRTAGGWGDASVQQATDVAARGDRVHLAGTFLGTIDFGKGTKALVNPGVTQKAFSVVIEAR